MCDYGLVYDRYWVGRMVMVIDLGLFGLDGWVGGVVVLLLSILLWDGVVGGTEGIWRGIRKGILLII